eukprot:CAMPEP_0170101120 /NCGR_PEP_ID=MMETSP0020_2-20130122/2071_1 /TAXON_ID=98059 /ORGANISM="Dinobryon sp., Strain UTEXLB2267" /LENGTH=229 /DNA_ID=CAMNT_0010324159 /DNA_START=105 /DNA_END=794 /DNA_ORIENTATION=+
MNSFLPVPLPLPGGVPAQAHAQQHLEGHQQQEGRAAPHAQPPQRPSGCAALQRLRVPSLVEVPQTHTAQRDLAKAQPPGDGVGVVQDDPVLLIAQDVHTEHGTVVSVHGGVDGVVFVDEGVLHRVGQHLAGEDQARLGHQRLLAPQLRTMRLGPSQCHYEDHSQREQDVEALRDVRTGQLEEVVCVVLLEHECSQLGKVVEDQNRHQRGVSGVHHHREGGHLQEIQAGV